MNEKKFNVTRDNDGKVTGIEFNAEAFIIPNHSGKITDFWVDYVAQRVKEVATSVLGKEPDKDELYVQMWYVADDLNCDNVDCGYPWVEIDGEEHRICIGTAYLPYTVLKGKDDGDTIDVTFNNADNWRDKDPIKDLKVTMHVTLNQKDYRYRRFGSFQDVLWKVTH